MTEALQVAAERLRQAYSNGPIPPLREYLDPQDIDRAYEVQAINNREWVASGRKLVGRKIGLTSRAVQQQIGVDQPDLGALFEDMRISDGEVLDPLLTIQPKAEAEIAFGIGRDIVSADFEDSDLLESLDFAVAAIEIVDSRIADWLITLSDTVADNGSSAFFVLGSEKKRLTDLDLYSCGMVMEVNGEVGSIGAGAACLGHPLRAVRWLAQRLADAEEPLRAGDIVLSGALGPMITLKPDDFVRAHIGGIGSCSFKMGSKNV